MSRLWRAVGVTVGTGVLVVGMGLSAIGPAGAAGPSAKGPKAKAPKVSIEVGDNFFKPDEIEITAGTKVTWTNKGKVLHNVRPVKGSKWGTKALVKGKNYSYKFKKPGKYAYYCSFHGSPTAGQRGTIVVAKPTPSTTTTTAAAATG